MGGSPLKRSWIPSPSVPGKDEVGARVLSGADPPPGRRGVVAEDLDVGADWLAERLLEPPVRPPEQRVVRRGLVEDGVGDDAVQFPLRTAGRHLLEGAALVAALLDGHVAADQQRRDELLANGGEGIDLLPDELGQHARPLRVADQDHAAAVVVAPHVLAPGGADVAVGELRRLGRDRGLADPRQRQLPVHRREHPAALREARRLEPGDRRLLRVYGEVGVGGRLVGDGRIDVEAVDLRALGQFRVDDLGGSVAA